MDPIIKTVYRSNIWVFPIFAIVLCGVNYPLATETIPVEQVLLTSLLFGVYYIWVYHIAVNGVWGGWKEKIGAACAMIVLLLTIEPTLKFLIYSCFPSFGVYLDKYMLSPNYVFDVIEFRRRWVSALTFICFLIGIRLAFRTIKNKRQEAGEMRNQIENLHSLLKSRQLNPHFMENFVAVALAREKRNGNRENKQMLMLLTQLMYYQLKMDNEKQTTSWQEEMEQFNNLLKMASYCDPNFVYKFNVDHHIGEMDVAIPHGLLLMPLENALKYGENVQGKPLQITFSKNGDSISVCYHNYFDSLLRSRTPTSGTGIRLMKARLEGKKWPIRLTKRETDNEFYVDIEIGLG